MVMNRKQSAADTEARRQYWRRKDAWRNINIFMNWISDGKAWRSALM